nr:transposase [Stappia indica]
MQRSGGRATKGGSTKRCRFNEEQIIAILKEQGAALGAADLCRKHGISRATFYKWKAKCGSPDAEGVRPQSQAARSDDRLASCPGCQNQAFSAPAATVERRTGSVCKRCQRRSM